MMETPHLQVEEESSNGNKVLFVESQTLGEIWDFCFLQLNVSRKLAETQVEGSFFCHILGLFVITGFYGFFLRPESWL